MSSLVRIRHQLNSNHTQLVVVIGIWYNVIERNLPNELAKKDLKKVPPKVAKQMCSTYLSNTQDRPHHTKP